MTTTTDTATAPIPVPVTPPPGFWQRDPSHFPLPLTPLSRRVHRQTEWFRTACAELGLLVDTIAFEDIGGWRYVSAVPADDVADRVATPSPPHGPTCPVSTSSGGTPSGARRCWPALPRCVASTSRA
jgi:hypothetical protein